MKYIIFANCMLTTFNLLGCKKKENAVVSSVQTETTGDETTMASQQLVQVT